MLLLMRIIVSMMIVLLLIMKMLVMMRTGTIITIFMMNDDNVGDCDYDGVDDDEDFFIWIVICGYKSIKSYCLSCIVPSL